MSCEFLPSRGGNGRYQMNLNYKTHHWITARNNYRLCSGYLPLTHTPMIMSVFPLGVIRVWCSCWRSSGPRQWARGQPRPRPTRRTSWGGSCRDLSGRLRTGSGSPWYKVLQENKYHYRSDTHSETIDINKRIDGVIYRPTGWIEIIIGVINRPTETIEINLRVDK